MNRDYEKIIQLKADHVFDIMRPRVSDSEMEKIKEAFILARNAHANQKRKTGEPYILHPIAVANIAAEELGLGANPVMAAFLHDVVEDTDYTIEDIRDRFGEDVAFLVGVVTKKVKNEYDYSKQVDNFRQMLLAIQQDIRPVLVKLADRLHNMRTLSSMRPDKQMKIAGETDYFYAPLANRLGFYNVKTELENLGLKFRCPHEYEEIRSLIDRDREDQSKRLAEFRRQIRETLAEAGIEAEVVTEYRQPYSIWRKMKKFGDDFNHLKYRHFTDIIFDTPADTSEKDMALKIYSVLTNKFKEKPGGISNYIDTPKENGYQSFHVKLLPAFGRWQEVHISSRRMVMASQLGCVVERTDDGIRRWLDRFRDTIQDLSSHGQDGSNFIENIVASFYNDDIMTFTRSGKEVILPQKATVLDFAYEVSHELGNTAKYARINGFLASIKAPLRRGDVVEVFSDPDCHPRRDWLDAVVTYKAKAAINEWLDAQPIPRFFRCDCCRPIPGEEVIGFRQPDRTIMLHKRDCPVVIRLASQHGDNIVSVDFTDADETLYPVTITVKAVDRYHLFIDLVDCITDTLHLAIDSINTETVDSIVTLKISFAVHSYTELQSIISHISAIPDVDEVKYD